MVTGDRADLDRGIATRRILQGAGRTVPLTTRILRVALSSACNTANRSQRGH